MEGADPALRRRVDPERFRTDLVVPATAATGGAPHLTVLPGELNDKRGLTDPTA